MIETLSLSLRFTEKSRRAPVMSTATPCSSKTSSFNVLLVARYTWIG